MARAEGLREYSFSIRVATMTDGVNTTLLYRKIEEDDWKPVITTNFKESFPPQFFSLGCWGVTEQNAELRILLQIRSVVKSGVELANALWAGI
jgi:hypothetical protein